MYLVGVFFLRLTYVCTPWGADKVLERWKKQMKWNKHNDKSIHSSPVKSSLCIRAGDHYLFNTKH